MSEKETFRLLVQIPWIIFVIYWIMGAIKSAVTQCRTLAVSV